MHFIVVILYCAVFLSVLKCISNLPYALLILAVLGCIGNVLQIDVSFVTIAGITFGAGDVLLAIMLFHIFAYKRTKIPKKSFYLLLMGYIFLLTISLISGILNAGINSNIIANFRKYFEYVIPWLIVACNADDLDLDFGRLNKWFDICAYIVVCFCCIGWIEYFFGMRESLRVIPSAGALLLSIYALLSMYKTLIIERKKFLKLESILVLITVLILQHNSVWAASAVGICIILIINFIKNKSDAIPIILFFLCVFLVIGYILNSNSDNVILQSINESMSKFEDMDSGTIGHRRQRWGDMLDSLSGMERYIGSNFSVGTVAGDGTTFSAHNAYVAAIMHSGFLGVIGFVGALLSLAFNALKQQKYLIFLLLISIMIYWYAYEPDINEAVIIGIMSYITFGEKRNQLIICGMKVSIISRKIYENIYS